MNATGSRRARWALLGAAATAALSLGLAAPASATGAPTAGTHVPATEMSPAACHVPAHANKKVLKKVYRIAKGRHVTHKVMLSTFETAWVESHVNNLKCGDADSVGVFQQRPSQGWCKHPKGCRNVKHATNKYLDQAIPNSKKHPKWTAGKVAQSVQRSAYPKRYNQAKPKAKKLIKKAKKLTS